MGQTACSFCGQEAVVFHGTARLGVLLPMLVETRQFRQAESVALEILRDHPGNAMAWAAQGLAAVQEGDPTRLEGAINCFNMSAKAVGADTPCGEWRIMAGRHCLELALLWSQQFAEDVVHNQQWSAAPFDNTKHSFAMLHLLALAAERLDPALKDTVDRVLGPIDDAMERRFDWFWIQDNYQADRRPRRPGLVGRLFRSLLGR